MEIAPFFDPDTFTLTYVVYAPDSREAVVIDPVLDFDPLASRVSTRSAEKVEAFLRRERLSPQLVLETHAHADHLSGSQFFKRRFGAEVGIGVDIRRVQQIFAERFALGPSFPRDGSQFDRLFREGEHFLAGPLRFEVLATPGHTASCVSYRIEDAVFTGDALFIEDFGTGRCDFPGGSADALYTSIHERLYALPDATRVFVGHDYQPKGRALRFQTTIGTSKAENVHLRADTRRHAFVELRNARDATLAPPRLLYPALRINIDAGRLPSPIEDGRRFLSIPLNPGERLEGDGTVLEALEQRDRTVAEADDAATLPTQEERSLH